MSSLAAFPICRAIAVSRWSSIRRSSNPARLVGNYRQQQSSNKSLSIRTFAYIADPRPTRRPDHWRLNGLILPKDHAFWRGHTGPWDYNCFCTVEELSAMEAEQEGISEAVVEGDRVAVVVIHGTELRSVLPPASGYSFDPEADGLIPRRPHNARKFLNFPKNAALARSGVPSPLCQRNSLQERQCYRSGHLSLI